MDMTPTMTAWAPTTAASARIAAGAWRTARNPRASEPPAGAAPAGGPAGWAPAGWAPGNCVSVGGASTGSACAASCRASMSGSGRSPARSRPQARTSPAPEMTNGPAMGGSPRLWPTTAPGWIRLGPATAPMVMAQTTADRERPRCSGSARSTAANRAWRFAAVPTPTPAAPTTRKAKTPETTDTTMSTAPARAAASPVARLILRPRRSASEASGSAAIAAASVIMVATEPAHASDPDKSTASNEPMDTVAPVPIALNSCADPRSTTVRRCTWRTSGSIRDVVAILRA